MSEQEYQGSPETAPQPEVEPLDPTATDEQATDPVVGEQVPGPATAAGFDPNRPVAISPPPPEDQTGDVVLRDEQTSGRVHPEASQTDPAFSQAADRTSAEPPESDAA